MGTLTHHASPWKRAMLRLSLILALISLVAYTPVHSQASLAATRKLSVITANAGAVSDAKIAGDRIVYLANYDVEDRFDLYSAPIAGGAVTRLTTDLPAASLDTYVITPAGQVVFSARHTATGLRYMYSVPSGGGALVLLGPTYPAVRPPLISSQLVFGLAGERVVFAVDAKVANAFELYSVPAAGGPLARLSPELPPTSGATFPAPFWVTGFAIDDGAGLHVAINLHQGFAPEGSGLYTVPADGSAPPTRIGDRVEKFDLTPDGQRVVYTRDDELRSVSFTGSGDSLIASGWSIPFAVTPDSARLVYALAGNYPDGGTIKAAPIAGGEPTTVATGVRYAAAYTFQLTPDGASVLFNDQDYTSLLLAPLSGGATKTVIAQPAGPMVQFTGDGTHAVFGVTSDGVMALYSYSLATGQALRIDDPAVSAGGSLYLEAVTGERVLYTAKSADAGDAYRLYSVPVAGGASTALTGDLGPRQELIAVRAAAGNTVVFMSGSWLNVPRRWRWLYAVPADGSAPPRLVDTPRSIVGDVSDYAVSPVDGRAVYLADQEQDGLLELYSVPVAGGAPKKLNAVEQRVVSFRISPVGGRVAYYAGSGYQASNLLFSVPIGGGAPTQVGTDIDPGSVISSYAFTPDGTRILYQAGGVGFPPTQTLYSAPAAGGAAVPLAENVAGFVPDPTGTRVAYVAGANPALLWSVPIVGGSPVMLGPVNPARPILFTADGGRVVYESGGDFFSSAALLSQPLAGGSPVTLAGTNDTLEHALFQLSADSAAVLYGGQLPRPDMAQPFSFRIQRIPVEGGAATTLAEVTLPAASSAPLLRFAQAPGGGPVVYALSHITPGGTAAKTLATVPVAGGQQTTLFSSTDANITPLHFKLSGDGSQALFVAEGALYRVLTAGGNPKLLSAGGAVGSFAFAEDGSTLFVEDGKLFHAPVGGMPIRVDDLSPGTAAVSFTQAGGSVIFTATTGAIAGTPDSGITELYAADITLGLPAIGFSASSASVVEGAGPAGIAVLLSGAASATITVDFRVVGGSAIADVDYSLGPAPLTFAPGETVKTLPLTVLDRPRFNGTRTIVIALGGPGAMTAAQDWPTTVVITITDDEHGLFLPLLRR